MMTDKIAIYEELLKTIEHEVVTALDDDFYHQMPPQYHNMIRWLEEISNETRKKLDKVE